MGINLLLPILKGAASFLPGFGKVIEKKRKKSKHSASSAEFCYTLWLSVLGKIKEIDYQNALYRVGEIGTGGSLGVGICALLTGSQYYYALEIDQEFDAQQNINLLYQLANLFKRKDPVNQNYLNLNIKTENQINPDNLINTNYLDDKLISQIREDIESDFKTNNRIMIVKDYEKQQPLQLDFIISRAVMEHVRNPYNVYTACLKHISSKGGMLHDIELHSHGLTSKPNGHIDIPPFLWKIIFGKRNYFLNRWTLDEHLNAISNLSFKIICKEAIYSKCVEYPKNILIGSVIIAEKS